MKKLNNRGRIRLLTGATLIIVIILALLFVFWSRNSGAWFTQKEDLQAVYDMGIVKLDGSDNIQYNIKRLNFSASTLLRGTTEDDENFNTCVFVAHGQVQNRSTVPIKVDFVVESTLVNEESSTEVRPNPGLMYSMFFCKSDPAEGSTEKSTLELLKSGDYLGYFNGLRGFSLVDVGTDGTVIPNYKNSTLGTQPFVIEPGEGETATYEMYWVFWVDHKRALEAVPQLQSNVYQPLTEQYGVTIGMRARQVDAPAE